MLAQKKTPFTVPYKRGLRQNGSFQQPKPGLILNFDGLPSALGAHGMFSGKW